jgi:hypothetical protein
MAQRSPSGYTFQKIAEIAVVSPTEVRLSLECGHGSVYPPSLSAGQSLEERAAQLQQEVALQELQTSAPTGQGETRMKIPGSKDMFARKERPSEQLEPDQSSRLHPTPEAKNASHATPIVTQWAFRKNARPATPRKDGCLCSILHP